MFVSHIKIDRINYVRAKLSQWPPGTKRSGVTALIGYLYLEHSTNTIFTYSAIHSVPVLGRSYVDIARVLIFCVLKVCSLFSEYSPYCGPSRWHKSASVVARKRGKAARPRRGSSSCAEGKQPVPSRYSAGLRWLLPLSLPPVTRGCLIPE